MTNSADLWRQVRSKPRLWRAWRQVYNSGIRSQSKETRNEVKGFQKAAPRHLARIERQLRQRRFKFKPARGIAQRRPGKAPRPIVQAQVENRVVQRAILDVIQDEPSVATIIQNENSFGGIRERGVREALEAAHNAIQAGAAYYIRSDIKQFFTRIPKSQVCSRLEDFVQDERFLRLVMEAMTVELENLAELGECAHLFPLNDVGVAQGSSLSPLAGNLLLADFDQQMTGRGVVCIRYIDDFLLLGSTPRNVHKTFERARAHLQNLGLDAYDPVNDPEKAARGWVHKGFEFLGCRVRPDQILPTRKARAALLESVQSYLDASVRQVNRPEKAFGRKESVIETLRVVSHVLQGWGNQYAYCNAGQFLRQLDATVDQRLQIYLRQIGRARRRYEVAGNSLDARRLLGVHPLANSKQDPIIESSIR